MDLLVPILIVIAIIAILAALAFTPRYGLLARWRVYRQSSRRQLHEDALKLIYNLRHEGQPVDKYRLAVELGLNLSAVQSLLDHLAAQQLVVANHHRLQLTADGQRLALQVIRAHRLWERYLADEARMPLEKIHADAHRREHQLTVDEVNELDAALGHPAHDPHGDPIPGADGVLRQTHSGVPLIQTLPGQTVQIMHLEDEPPLAYAQLIAEGLYIGQQITVQENAPQRIVISSEVNEHTLARAIAENVSVQVIDTAAQPGDALIPLGSLAPKERAEIIHIDERCQGFTRRRFLDLGLTPGTPIFPELENAFKDPRAYRVRGTLIALRSEQAALIWVRPLAPTPAAN